MFILRFDYLRGLSVVLLTAVTYYSERIQSIISKRKRCMRQSLEKTRCKLLKVLSPWSYIGHA